MSIDMYLSQAQTQSSSVKALCTRQQNSYERLINSFGKFTSDTELRSQAYDSAKCFFDVVLIPLVQGATLLSETVMEANQKFPEEYIARVESGDLKSSELEEQINEWNEQILALEEQRKVIRSSSIDPLTKVFQLTKNALVSGMYSKIKSELEEKLRKLTDFHSYSPSIFSDIEQLKALVQEGNSQANGCWSGENGVFVLPEKSKMGWAEKVAQQWQERLRRQKNPTVYDENGEYGGDQGSPASKFYSDEKFAEIIRSYYPDYTEAEMLILLRRLNNEGCGYVAMINTIFVHYENDPKGFEEKFGFPMYSIDENGYKVMNYDYLLVDFYCATDNRNKKSFLFFSWEELDEYEDYKEKDTDGNIIDGPKFDYDLRQDATGSGTSVDSREYRMEKYMSDHGISVDVRENISATASNYDKLAADGQVVIRVNPVKMYDKNGNEKYIEGGHAMTVTGKDSNGNLIVSSWGEIYTVNPNDFPVSNYDGSYADLQVVVYE